MEDESMKQLLTEIFLQVEWQVFDGQLEKGNCIQIRTPAQICHYMAVPRKVELMAEQLEKMLEQGGNYVLDRIVKELPPMTNDERKKYWNATKPMVISVYADGEELLSTEAIEVLPKDFPVAVHSITLDISNKLIDTMINHEDTDRATKNFRNKFSKKKGGSDSADRADPRGWKQSWEDENE